MLYIFQRPMLLQVTEGIKSVVSATALAQEQLQHDATMSLLWWIVLVLTAVCISLGMALVRFMTGHGPAIEVASKVRVDGHAKAELELKNKHALELALNEANSQGIIRGLQKSLDDSNEERRALTTRINGMAHDMAQLFDTFAGKFNTFTELQASTVAHMERFRLEVLLEISHFFSKKA